MKLYPKYISDKFLTFFWNIFSFYSKCIYTIWFCAISELLFIFFEIYVSGLFFLYFTSQDRFVSFLEKYPKASCWSRSFFHKKYKQTKIEIKIVWIYLSRALSAPRSSSFHSCLTSIVDSNQDIIVTFFNFIT